MSGKAKRTKTKRIRRDDWDLFFERHKPVKNHLNPHAGYVSGDGPGCLFETFGAEVEFVKQQPPNKVFTLLDDGRSVVPGWHFVNRLGYFVAEIPWTEKQAQRIYRL